MFKRNQLMMDSIGDVMIITRKSTKLNVKFKWLMLEGKVNHPLMNPTTYQANRHWIKDNFTPITSEVMDIMRKGV